MNTRRVMLSLMVMSSLQLLGMMAENDPNFMQIGEVAKKIENVRRMIVAVEGFVQDDNNQSEDNQKLENLKSRLQHLQDRQNRLTTVLRNKQ